MSKTPSTDAYLRMLAQGKKNKVEVESEPEITITADELQYLAKLVDEDTTGNQDDLLYRRLMRLWNGLGEGDIVSMEGVHLVPVLPKEQ